MRSTKSVCYEDVENLMEQMRKVDVIRESEKRKMLSSSSRNSIDPNLIMDLRHEKISDSLPVSWSKSIVLAEATKMLMDEETQALYRKREEELLENELRKFEKGLSSSRPKFRGPYSCGRRNKFNNWEDYEDLWKMAPRRIKVMVNNKNMPKMMDFQSDRCNINDNSLSVETIKVTIKEKAGFDCKERDRELMKMSLQVLANYAKEESRLRELRLRIQENMANRRMRKYFDIWKVRMKNAKKLAMRKKQATEISDERKIEMFINAINEKQKKMVKKSVGGEASILRNCDNGKTEEEDKKLTSEVRKTSGKKIVHVVEPPSHNRLNAQKKIIAQQRIKLAEQNKIIEELKLQKIEQEAKKSGIETLNVAKEALAHCGQRTRRTLLQLMREEGCRDKSLLEPPRIPSPPRFLARMEARAEARRERVRIAEEERRLKSEERRMKEEAARREEEENRKRLKTEARREAKRIREELEKKRVREMERLKEMNDMAENFYRKYLIRRYIIDPLISLVEIKHNHVKIAENHYRDRLLKKSLQALQREAINQRETKLELSITIWRRNLLSNVFNNWLESTRQERKKNQVAIDFYEFHLQERYLKIWSDRAMELKMKDMENIRLAISHLERRMKIVYFKKWLNYMKISEDVKESDRRKNEWRELVQRVVPDFDPKQRGVIIDD